MKFSIIFSETHFIFKIIAPKTVQTLFITQLNLRISANPMFITFDKVNKMFISTYNCEKNT